MEQVMEQEDGGWGECSGLRVTDVVPGAGHGCPECTELEELV